MPATYATATDVLDRWVGPGKPKDQALVQRWVDDAEAVLRRSFTDLDAYVDEDTERADVVRTVLVRMVTRVFRNPSGNTTGTRVAGPFTESWTRSGGRAGGSELYVSPAELTMIVGRGGGGAFEYDTDPRNRPSWVGW